jgi:hypothetical protein
MAKYQVECFRNGKRDENGRQSVDALDPKSAAEKICGGTLRDKGKLGDLRAMVWRATVIPSSTPEATFYVDPD